MFNIGDVVRLKRGWTPMVVIRLNDDGTLTAKYANNAWNWVTKEDYDCSPHRAYSSSNTYTRKHSGFAAWEGEPISKKNFIMTNRYKSTKQPHISGVFLNTSSAGAIIIETDRGDIVVLDAQDAARDIPFTFEVKATHNNYRCHYTLPQGTHVNVGDVLVSDSGNFYVVTELNTERYNPKGVFKGHRVLKESL